MKLLSTLSFLCILVLTSHFANAQPVQAKAIELLPAAIKPVPAEQEEEGEQEGEEQGEQNSEEEGIVEAIRIEGQQPGAREIRLTLWDGTVVMGSVNIEYVKVETQFGKLEVPVQNIIQFRPGLDSFPELTERINSLVEQLDNRDFQTRERAHRELVGMGVSIRSVLHAVDPGTSAERKKHLLAIREEIDEMVDGEENWDEGGQEPELVRGDTLQTRDFTIVGKILQPEFVLNSKYGELTISLSDIKSADRTWMRSTQAVTKTVNVKGESFFQTTPISSKIRVNKGDRIRIRASGSVHWATWGNINSTPNGITNQGNWLNFNCGTLLARIGTGNDYEKIGEKGDFVAKSNGILYLGIAMRDNYANQANYQWPGSYKAKITVTPGAEE